MRWFADSRAFQFGDFLPIAGLQFGATGIRADDPFLRDKVGFLTGVKYVAVPLRLDRNGVLASGKRIDVSDPTNLCEKHLSAAARRAAVARQYDLCPPCFFAFLGWRSSCQCVSALH